MRHKYAEEKLGMAIMRLATWRGTVNERLLGAAEDLCVLEPKRHFPAELGEKFESLWDTMNRMPARCQGESALRATLLQIPEGEAAEHAESLFLLYDSVVDSNRQRV